MQIPQRQESDPILFLAYWWIMLLSVVTFLLFLLLVVMLLGGIHRSAPQPWLLLVPAWYALLTWIYCDIIEREKRRPSQQRSMRWLISANILGFVSMSLLMVMVFSGGFSDAPFFLLLFAIGVLPFVAGYRIVMHKRTKLEGGIADDH